MERGSDGLPCSPQTVPRPSSKSCSRLFRGGWETPNARPHRAWGEPGESPFAALERSPSATQLPLSLTLWKPHPSALQALCLPWLTLANIFKSFRAGQTDGQTYHKHIKLRFLCKRRHRVPGLTDQPQMEMNLLPHTSAPG